MNNKLISILLSSTMVLNSVQTNTHNEQKYLEKINEFFSEINDTNITIDYLLENYENIIESNPYIGDFEKNFLKQTKIIIEDNKNFVNPVYIKNILSNLKIYYNTNLGEYTQGIIKGKFNLNEKAIYISDTKNNMKTDLLMHEILHSFTEFIDIDNLYFNELVNEIYNNEYNQLLNIENTYTIYDYDLRILYLIMNIINIDYIKEYKFKNDINIIYDGFLNEGIQKEKVTELLEHINSLWTYFNNEAYKTEYIEAYQEIHKLIFEFYEHKYDNDFYEQIDLMAYTSGTHLKNYVCNEKLITYFKTLGLNYYDYYSSGTIIDYNSFIASSLIEKDNYIEYCNNDLENVIIEAKYRQ